MHATRPHSSWCAMYGNTHAPRLHKTTSCLFACPNLLHLNPCYLLCASANFFDEMLAKLLCVVPVVRHHPQPCVDYVRALAAFTSSALDPAMISGGVATARASRSSLQPVAGRIHLPWNFRRILTRCALVTASPRIRPALRTATLK